MQDFRNLKVWQSAHEVALKTYKATEGFPKSELYGLTNQIRRAAVSVSANIAEGCGRGSDLDFARFLQIAMGSASELEYELLLSRDLGFLKPEDHENLNQGIHKVKQMLASLLKKLRADS
ncbi:MAG: four helix bundle protein [Anaerolineaceae bacterium]|nr:four helix bundle protein [Anaerolineaceae bacterium]